jgi:predicted RNase H-like nuclease (RuvC/YqgF family)
MPVAKPKIKSKLRLSTEQQNVRALKAENAKLHTRIFKLEAENISLHNRIAEFEKDRKERMKHGGPTSIKIIHAPTKPGSP